MEKRISLVSLLLALTLAVLPVALAAEGDVHIAVLKGPTGMGAAQLMADNEQGYSSVSYDFTIAGAPDVVTAQLVTGELDMAALPTNTIALLASRMPGQVQALAVNTLGVLYVLERGDSVHEASDLAGKTIVSAGRGSTTQVVADYLFGEDVTIDYVSEHAEAVAQAVAGKYDLVLLPEPFVTSLLSQDQGFSIAIDLTRAWEAATGTMLPMGGIAVRTEFAQNNPQAIAAFLEEYAQSVAFANESPVEAAALIEQYGIMAAAIAENAIPRANMVCMTGDDMRAALEAFYHVLMAQSPELLGGAMPDDAFYYVP